MYALIALLLPSLLGLKVMDYLLKGLTIKNIIFYYCILLLISQGINNLILVSFFDIDNLWNSLNDVSNFFSIYILISSVINVLLVLIFVVLIKNIKLEVEVEYAGKIDENKTNSVKSKQKDSNKKSKNFKGLFTKVKSHFKKDKNK